LVVRRSSDRTGVETLGSTPNEASEGGLAETRSVG
jgi:hypothetical protein